jgi:hypothetical protein
LSHRRNPPILKLVGVTEDKSFRRLVKRLIAIRLAYGKSSLIDTHTHIPHYPIDVISVVLIGAYYKAKQLGEQLVLSTDECRLWRQMFPRTKLKLHRGDEL